MTGFVRDTRDLIDYVKLSPADTVFLARNLLDVQTRGLDADAVYNRSIGAASVRFNATYTRLASDLGDVAEGTEYKYSFTNSRHIVQGNVSATAGPLSVGVQGLWKDRLTGESYGVLNLRAGYAFYLGRQRLTFSGEVRNLLDATYSEVFDAPMPGRWWLLGVRISR